MEREPSRTADLEVRRGAQIQLASIVREIIADTPFGLPTFLLIVLLYGSLAGLAAWHHEPWFDEAQAFLIARDATPREIAVEVLRYEGHPPLWYLVLSPAARLGMPFRFISIFSVVIATAGIAMFLALPGIPRIVRVLAPFSYILLYQFAVIARSYVLIPLLLFLIAYWWRRRFERPAVFALLLALLIHVSLHGASIAFVIFVQWAVEWIKQGFSFRRALLPLLILTVASVVFLALLLPLPDDISIREKLQENWFLRLARAADLGLVHSLLPGRIGSILVLGAMIPWLHQRRVLPLLAGLLLAIILTAGVYLNIWHLGFFFCVFLFVFCIAAQSEPGKTSSRGIAWTVVAVGAMTLVLAAQTLAALRAVSVEIAEPYSGSQAAAEVLGTLPLDRITLHGLGFPAIAVQAHFKEPIFDNYGRPLWWRWSSSSPWAIPGRGGIRIMALTQWLRRSLAARPDYVLLPMKFPTDRIPLEIMTNRTDYQFVAGFQGTIRWKGRFYEPDSLVLFRRIDSSAPLPVLETDHSGPRGSDRQE